MNELHDICESNHLLLEFGHREGKNFIKMGAALVSGKSSLTSLAELVPIVDHHKVLNLRRYFAHDFSGISEVPPGIEWRAIYSPSSRTPTWPLYIGAAVAYGSTFAEALRKIKLLAPF